jgi:hypothetical protein
VAAAGLALLPLALEQRQNAAWIAAMPLGQRLGQVPPQFVLGIGAPARNWLKIAGAAGLLVSVACVALSADARARRGAAVAGGVAVAGFALGLGLIAIGFDELITRNLIVIALALIVVVASGLGAARAAVPGWAGAAAMCAIGVISTITVGTDWKLERPDWRGVARVAAPSRPAGAARAFLLENDPSLIPLGDYVPGLYVMRLQGPPVRELVVVAAVKGPTVALCWWGASCHLPLAPLDTSLHLPGFHRAGRVLHVNQFSIYRLRAVSLVRLSRGQVERALRGTPVHSHALLVQPAAHRQG